VKDLKERGLHPEYLRRLCKRGVMMRTGRGLYVLADHEFSEHLDLAEAARRVPKGMVCLLSALHFHGIGTQLPRSVWMMIDRRAHKPRVDYPPIRFMRASGMALTEGIEHYSLDGVDVPLYSVAKTVADCFRYRNKIGLDVALEALRECWRERRCTMDDLWKYATICRVGEVMRPYLEATM
jgi:predicted transcriptional regulator of viral defense system